MDTGEIARERWIRFFDDFSRNHEGWIVSLDVLAPSLGAQEEVAGLPLVGITADVKGRRSRVEIILGGRSDAHVTRIIESPKRVWVKVRERPGHEAIDVESDDGTMTLMRFLHVEQVDRLLPGEVANPQDRSKAAGGKT